MKVKRSISGKILTTTILIMILLSAVLASLMVRSMTSLTDTILSNVLPSMIKTASQSVEGNIHVLADRIFMIGDNEILTTVESSKEQKLKILDKAQSGIEFVWLGLYDVKGELYVGHDTCPKNLKERSMFPLLEETQNLVVDDVNVRDGELELCVGIPISNAEGEFLYYLVGSYKYDVLNDVLTSINISANGEAYIVNSDGKIMGNRNKELVLEQKDMGEYTGSDILEDKVLSGETGVMVIERGKEAWLVGYVPINGTNWHLTIILPRSDFMGAAHESTMKAALITFLLLVVAILVIIGFSSKIRRSLKVVTNRIEWLAQGDLKTPTEIVETKDETQVLSVKLNDTITAINHYISQLSDILSSLSEGNFDVSIEGEFQGDFVQIKKSLNQIIVSLNTMLKSVQDSSEEVLVMAKTVSESSSLVHTGSAKQSDSLMVLSGEAKAIDENIIEVDERTKLAGELMQRAKHSMSVGDQNMKNLLKAMGDINDNSNEIIKVNKSLEDIALQTNLLALNASVEAGRAGEAGKGFAVVAAEVRDLAAQSTEFAHHASEVISNSQNAVEQGMLFVKQAAESFEDIEDISSQMADITKHLEEAVTIQKDSLSNMSKQIVQINDIAQQNLNASYESTTASQKLHKQAEDLQNISNRFRLRRFM